MEIRHDTKFKQVYKRVQLQNDRSGEIFCKQLIDLGSSEIPVNNSTGCITFPVDFCQFTETTTELIQKVFPNVCQNYKDHFWVSERAIIATKNTDVNYIYIYVLLIIGHQ